MPKAMTNFFAFILVICFVSSLGYAIEREISWTEDYEAAVQRAATTNGILLLHFYGDYCPPCKLLDKKTFHDPAVVSKMNEHLIPVKINADRRRDLVQKFQVTRWPTDVYLFSNGDEIYRGVSNADPAVYCKTIERVALRHRDWTVERNSMAVAKERRQDKAIAARTPQIRTEQPLYSGTSGHSVKSQAAAWTNPSIHSPISSQVNVSNSPRSSGSRVIDNPYFSREPINVPAAIESLNQNGILPITSVNQAPNGPPPNSQSKVVVAQPTSSVRNLEPELPQPPIIQHQPSAVQRTQQQVDDTPTPQHVFAETIGLEGYCPVTLIQSIGQENVNGWVEGEKSFAVRHRGRVYYCASEQSRQTLLADPDRFTPCLSGFDIVQLCKEGVLRDGKCEYGCIQEGSNRVFLFESKANYDEFIRNIQHYADLLGKATPERVAAKLNGTQNR